MVFADRADAGRRLAARLGHLRGEPVVVLGLPRGGVPVAFEVAPALDAPLDVIVVRKLGVPFQPELGMGAVGEGGVRIINDRGGSPGRGQRRGTRRGRAAGAGRGGARARRFRGERAPSPLAGRTVVVVDDGIATGSTARAACQVARAHGAARVVLAVPVGPPDIAQRIGPAADEVVCLDTPADFVAVGQFYADFSQTTDDEVVDLLERAAAPSRRAAGAGAAVAADPPGRSEEVVPVAGGCDWPGSSPCPTAPRDSSCSRMAAAARGTARATGTSPASLNDAGLGTLLFDLLTVEEELDRGNVFDIELLAGACSRSPAGCAPSRASAAPHRLLRRQHRRRGRAVRRRRPRRGRRRRGIPRRPARPRRPAAGRGPRPDAAHRRRLRRGRARAQPRRSGPSCAARTGWRSCPARPTCSRSRAPSTPSPASPATGSPPTSPRPPRVNGQVTGPRGRGVLAGG